MIKLYKYLKINFILHYKAKSKLDSLFFKDHTLVVAVTVAVAAAACQAQHKIILEKLCNRKVRLLYTNRKPLVLLLITRYNKYQSIDLFFICFVKPLNSSF